jgi:small subunit ribosomal protein S8
MSMSDPIADLLTRIRNARLAGHTALDVPNSKLKVEVCRVLKEEGYITDYSVEEEPVPGIIHVTMKYMRDRTCVLQGLRRISKPSLRVYQGTKEIRPVLSGLGVSILTTSKGVMTGRQARKEGIGGEVLCEVW